MLLEGKEMETETVKMGPTEERRIMTSSDNGGGPSEGSWDGSDWSEDNEVVHPLLLRKKWNICCILFPEKQRTEVCEAFTRVPLGCFVFKVLAENYGAVLYGVVAKNGGEPAMLQHEMSHLDVEFYHPVWDEEPQDFFWKAVDVVRARRHGDDVEAVMGGEEEAAGWLDEAAS